MNLALAWRLARRELRGGLKSFRVFLACLAIGVGAIAAVGSVASAITSGLQANGRTLLGGDAELRFTHRIADADELAWLSGETAGISEVIDFRGMAGAPNGDRAVAQIKAIDVAYPLVGALEMRDGVDLAEALAERNGVYGAVAEATLLDRLDVQIGDALRIGTKSVELRGVIEREPDRQANGIELGPRLMVARPALEGSGLMQPGSLYYSAYRVVMPDGGDANALKERFDAEFPEAGGRWQQMSDPAPRVSGTVERIGTFLVLVGLASLAVGGVGVSAATRGYLERKTETIATLKTLGASGSLVVTIYLMQILVLALIGVGFGLLLGAGIPMLFSSQLAGALPVPASFGIYPAALGEAALYGLLTALLFALWPLALARETPAAVLFRDIVDKTRRWPRAVYLAVIVATGAALAGSAIWFAGNAKLGAAFVAGLAIALAAFAATAWVVRQGAQRLARRRGLTANRPALRMALAAIGGPGGETAGVMLSLGMGLTLLSTIGQIDSNLRGLVSQDISEAAPAFFVIDIPAYQFEDFAATARALPEVERMDTAPMLRGRLIEINGETITPESVPPEARWVVRGERGLTYADALPEGSVLAAGEWWPENYTGEPQVSFAEEEALELGLALGDTITVKVLGRDLTATITNFRKVEWEGMRINFTMVFNSASLKGAPHSHIATVYAPAGSEGKITRALAADFPSAVPIPVRDIVNRTEKLLGDLANGVRGASLATLLSGLVVLIGATAAGQRRLLYEAAILKTLGATRGALMRAFSLRYLLLGGIAALVALALGTLAAWAVTHFVFKADFSFDAMTGLLVSALGIAATLGTGIAFAWSALSARPAAMLRGRA